MRTHEHTVSVDLDKGVMSEKARRMQRNRELLESFGGAKI